MQVSRLKKKPEEHPLVSVAKTFGLHLMLTEASARFIHEKYSKEFSEWIKKDKRFSEFLKKMDIKEPWKKAGKKK